MACREVAERARFVQIELDLVTSYAACLPARPASEAQAAGEPPADRAARERIAAFWLTLDAINFGSGWFPTLRKAPGASGYGTVSGALRGRFERHGPWAAGELAGMTAGEIAETLGQDSEHELMVLFARSLRDLGGHLLRDHRGSFTELVDRAGGSAVALVERLAAWDCFSDVSAYEELQVPFLKRAQIAAADLARSGAASFSDLAGLTMFADNLVPHVLRLDGVLRFAPDLVDRIEREELLIHGSPEEVEIRACAVHAVELIAAASSPKRIPAEIDEVLWSRGQGGAYKARPRHRSRCTAY